MNLNYYLECLTVTQCIIIRVFLLIRLFYTMTKRNMANSAAFSSFQSMKYSRAVDARIWGSSCCKISLFSTICNDANWIRDCNKMPVLLLSLLFYILLFFCMFLSWTTWAASSIKCRCCISDKTLNFECCHHLIPGILLMNYLFPDYD